MEVRIRNHAPIHERYTYGGGISVRESGQAPKKLRSVSKAIGRALAAETFGEIRDGYAQKII